MTKKSAISLLHIGFSSAAIKPISVILILIPNWNIFSLVLFLCECFICNFCLRRFRVKKCNTAVLCGPSFHSDPGSTYHKLGGLGRETNVWYAHPKERRWTYVYNIYIYIYIYIYICVCVCVCVCVYFSSLKF